MDHSYNYYKKLPRDDIVGGFIEFSGGADIDDDFYLDSDSHIHAEVFGAADSAKSASTIDDGILKLFGDDRGHFNLGRTKARSEDVKTIEFGPKVPKAAPKTARKGKKRGAAEISADTFTFDDAPTDAPMDASTDTPAPIISPEEFTL